MLEGVRELEQGEAPFMPHKEGSRTYSLRFESFYLHISTLRGSGGKQTSGPNLGAQEQSDEPRFCCARKGWHS